MEHKIGPKFPNVVWPSLTHTPDRNLHEIPGEPPNTIAANAAAILGEVKQGGSYIPSGLTPPKILDFRLVVVPAAGQVDFNLPGDYDWVAFYFPSNPGATLSVGVGAPFLPVLAAGFLILPFTSRNFKMSNTAGAAYTVYFIGGMGVERPSFTTI